MPDSRFFKVAGPFTLKQLAEISGSIIAEGANPDKIFSNVCSLHEGDENSISFLLSKKYLSDLEKTKAGACIVSEEFKDKAPKGVEVLVAKEPYRAYGLVAQAFYPNEYREETFIHEKAFVDPTAKIGKGCIIEAGAFVGANAEIGAHTHVCANASIEKNVILGEDCIVGMNASVQYTIAGNKVYIYPGARIGQDGFGFHMGQNGHTKIPQLGRVLIGNDVEIGANTCLDRGALDDTVIGDGSRLDNLIQFGHNVQTGKCCVVVAQAGVAGSTHLGDFVVLAGQSGIAGHLNIGSGTQIAAQSGVMRDVGPMEHLMGTPAVPAKEFMRQFATIKKLVKGGDAKSIKLTFSQKLKLLFSKKI
ncbi:MAG: UDP-3-O-(3-hydroxymyristoyl)glucosamine N-acyltransferase [Alphaproteobacteria bacterium]|nr:UDP-3-O-(3-hydroxymyristoyl)glucosamine N-acyltransferase [Alphaproteobacteria bacterium]